MSHRSSIINSHQDLSWEVIKRKLSIDTRPLYKDAKSFTAGLNVVFVEKIGTRGKLMRGGVSEILQTGSGGSDSAT